jgi:hypothetical protein
METSKRSQEWWHKPVIPALRKKEKGDGKFKAKLGTVVLIFLGEGEIWRIAIPGHPSKKICETPSQQKKLCMVVHVCHSSYGRKPKIGRLQSRLAQAKGKTLTQKQLEQRGLEV